jgi:hypothetical protein
MKKILLILLPLALCAAEEPKKTVEEPPPKPPVIVPLTKGQTPLSAGNAHFVYPSDPRLSPTQQQLQFLMQDANNKSHTSRSGL